MSDKEETRGRPKGLAKTGGRKPGSRNAKSLARDAGLRPLVAELRMKRFDVIGEMIKLYRDEDTNNNERLQILREFMDRIAPRLSPVKVELPVPREEDEEQVIEMSEAELLKLAKEDNAAD